MLFINTLNRFNDGNKEFIINNNLENHIGKPININGNIYYPILHENLFLRYYISYSYCIYDILTKSIKKLNPYDKVKLESTDSHIKNQYDINELFWTTFFRFPRGSYLSVNESGEYLPVKYEKRYIGKRGRSIEYIIENVKFSHIRFPRNNRLFDTFSRLVVSEDGAIFDINKRQFIMIKLDNEGVPYIYEDGTDTPVKLSDIFAYSLFDIFKFDPFIHDIKVHSVCEAFTNKSNIIIYDRLSRFDKILYTNLILQDISDGSIKIDQKINNDITLRKSNKIQIDINNIQSEFGIFTSIPIIGLTQYKISKSGVIINGRSLLYPKKIIYDSNKNPIDILYKFPKINNLFSAIELILWTYYRLNSDIDIKYTSSITFHDNFEIPLINKLIISIPEYEVFENGKDLLIYLNNLCFKQMKKYKDLYISTSGAIINLNNKRFLEYSGVWVNKSLLACSIPIEDHTELIYIFNEMYKTWFDKSPLFKTKIIPINGVKEDFSIYNLRTSFIQSSYGDDIDINNLKILMNKIQKRREYEKSIIYDIYNIIDIDQLLTKIPINEY